MRILRTVLTKPVSSSRAPTSSRNVVRGLAADTTERARISSPEASMTPTARPFSTTILPTGAPVRIATPAFSAAPAIAATTAPMPPTGIAWAPGAPAISPVSR